MHRLLSLTYSLTHSSSLSLSLRHCSWCPIDGIQCQLRVDECFCWWANSFMTICRSPLENTVYKFVFTSPAVSCISCLYYFDELRQEVCGRTTALLFVAESSIYSKRHAAWSAIDREMTTRKSDPSNQIKRKFFQAVAVSLLLYSCIFSL